MSKKQNDRVLERLRQGPLTPGEAYSELGVMRLGARIYDLRGMGHEIAAEMIPVINKHGETTHVARYTLTENAANDNAQHEDQAA